MSANAAITVGSSLRVAKARALRYYTKPLRLILASVVVIFAVGGLALVITHSAFSWLLFGIAVLPAMWLEWWRGDLRDLPPSSSSQSIGALLEGEVLSHLNNNPSPADLVKAILQTNGGKFFAVRFGLTPRFLDEITSKDATDTQAVWQEALKLQSEVGAKGVSAGILLTAIVRHHSQADEMLAQLQISVNDLVSGVQWYRHMEELFKRAKDPKRTGGIARDWSFGWIPALQKFGVNISKQLAYGNLSAIHLESHKQALDQMIDTFSSSGRQNITLVGPAGVGKTTLVNAFAERLMDASSKLPGKLKFRQVIMLDASALISAAPGRGQLEGLMSQLLNEAYHAKNIIICLDDAQLFFEEGVGSVDLTNLLVPILEGGGLRMILTMDEQRWLQISQRNSSLVNAMNRVMVKPANKEETLKVLQDQLIFVEFQQKVSYMYQALLEAYRLSERYVHDLAMPGRALKLLESAASYNENGLVTAHSVQQAIEQTMDIKVGVASGGEERSKLLNLEKKIHERMINQTRAVKVVSDALRRARAGVRNQDRPIGTFLFLGPTGVGKTELSKALADVYFGGEDRILRIDLNEYVKSDDVSRLIADGADDPHSLTAQVMKQPFSVVLLDEIEKAHPNVLTTLLQLLDEGILRDIKNREVSFRDAIVVATSNAGAQKIRQHIEKGEKVEQFEEQFVNELIDSQEFRPEFLNRFDEIVVFRPLTKEELLQVADIILVGVNKNLENQKVSVKVADDAKALLVERGYDPRLGARPIRREVQRSVENIVAKRMLEAQTKPGSVIEISRADIEAIKEEE